MSDSSKIRTPGTDALMEAILTLESADEAYAFFEDLCTIAEIHSMAQRLEVARMLSQGKTYQEISSRTGASTATISRVNRAIMWGENGYLNVFSKLGEKEKGKRTDEE